MKHDKVENLFDFLPKSKFKAADGLDKGPYPFYTSSETQSKYLDKYLYEPGCLVFGTGGKASVHLATRRFATSTDCIAIRPKSNAKIDAGYVFHYLKGNIQILEKGFKGAGLRHISKGYISAIQIPHPENVDDQKRIAHLLSKVEGLIAQRKQHLQQLDGLLKSVFWEMFGDYLRDESSYELITKACDFVDYRGKTPPRSEGGVPLISAKCVRRGYFDASRLDYVTEETYQKIMTRGFPKPNDVLFTTEGATFGYTCRIPRNFKKFSVGQRLITMQCRDGYQPEVLEFVLNHQHIQKKLASRLSGSAALGIRSAELAKVTIPFPSPAFQADFATIVEKGGGVKSNYQQSLADLESLYGVLSQKAFKGVLDLSRVPLPAITGSLNAVEEVADTFTAAGTVTQPQEVIDLPDVENMADALTTTAGRERILMYWLDAYLAQLNGSVFSINDFLSAAQVRMSEVCPDIDFEIGLTEYDQLKDWVFQALKTGRLFQTFDDENKKIKLESIPPQWGSW